ncbi:MAG: YceI family protein [Planctomycetaceae bacterium]
MRRIGFLMTVAMCGLSQAAFAADDYTFDALHSSISFKVRHLDISWVHGRFNEMSGKFSIDKTDPAKSSFELSIKADSIDTGNKDRDKHLKQPDFFDSKQYPNIDFKSTGVKAIEGGYEVTGDITMHGKTKKITFKLTGGKEADFYGKRIGFGTELTLKRSDFGFDPKNIGPIGDDTLIFIDFEGVRK